MPQPIVVPETSRSVAAVVREQVGTGRLAVWSICAVIAISVLVLSAKAWLVAFYVVPSESMEPTIRSGERVVVDKLSYAFRGPERGEVVVFDGSGIFADPAPGEHMFVKRVIGVAGDHVKCCDRDGRMTVNGTQQDESQYLPVGVEPSQVRFDVLVPPDSLWLMGDNRRLSADSRSYIGKPSGGFVPIGRLQGRAMVDADDETGVGSK